MITPGASPHIDPRQPGGELGHATRIHGRPPPLFDPYQSDAQEAAI